MAKTEFKEITDLNKLKEMMVTSGAAKLFVKPLSPNDNSKNQVYLGPGFEALNTIPNKGVYVDGGRDGSKRDRFKADVFLGWMGANGHVYSAPNAQLILYPKYPEVRMSGFLQGCEYAPSDMMRSRLGGRLLFLGVRNDGQIIGHVTSPDNPIYKHFKALENPEPSGVFFKIPLDSKIVGDTRDQLIAALKEIHLRGWVDSVKLNKEGVMASYKAGNGGGYTLEALLGISPNGYADPDYLGWEIKQHGVTGFNKPHSGSPITLMTPEPNAGIYKDKGVEYFIRKFGYPDKNGKPDRFNFGGVYRNGVPAQATGLTLHMPGYDIKSGKIIDAGGGLTLLSPSGEEAAIWRFADMMKHWNRKHAQAVYVPSLRRKASDGWQYQYGNMVEMGEGTDFLKFLRNVANGTVYYDPGIKLENASSAKPKTKRRSQFRIKPIELKSLYDKMELVDVAT